MANEVIETRTAKTWLGEDGIIRQIIFSSTHHTLADAKENVATTMKLGKDKKHPMFYDARKLKSIERDARIYYAREEANKATCAAAIIVGLPISSVIGNLFIGLNKPLYPAKLFSSEDEALKWLKGFLK